MCMPEYTAMSRESVEGAIWYQSTGPGGRGSVPAKVETKIRVKYSGLSLTQVSLTMVLTKPAGPQRPLSGGAN